MIFSYELCLDHKILEVFLSLLISTSVRSLDVELSNLSEDKTIFTRDVYNYAHC